MRVRLATGMMGAALVMCASSGVVSQSPESSDTYTITDLGTLGGTVSSAAAINASGQVVGWARIPGDAAAHAFLWQDGSMTDLGTLGGSHSWARSINASGQIVGSSYNTGNEAYRAFLWDDDRVMKDLGGGSGYSDATAINASGLIVGWAHLMISPSIYQRAVLWQNGDIMDLGTLGGVFSAASGINDSGQVAGAAQKTSIPLQVGDGGIWGGFFWQDQVMRDLGPDHGFGMAINASGQVVGSAGIPDDAVAHAFLWQDGAVRYLDIPKGNLLRAINASGQVVGGGCCYDDDGASNPVGTDARALLWHDGILTDLNTLLPPDSGWVLVGATGINDSGQIVGSGYFNGQLRGFLLTPRVTSTVAFTVEAQTFAGGGQGCWQGPFFCGGAYHDETPGNWGDAHVRPHTDIDLWYDDGGIVIGALDGLEWVTFPVNVPRSGWYSVTFRTASPADRPGGSGVINVGIHGVAGSWVGNQHVPVTGGPGEWHSYVSWNAPHTIYLPAGLQTLTMWASGGWYNVRNMTFTLDTNSRE